MSIQLKSIPKLSKMYLKITYKIQIVFNFKNGIKEFAYINILLCLYVH
jgi:hypothetical protein